MRQAAATFFSDLLEKGHKGEAIVSSFFQSIGYDVQDVSSDQAYFATDIDLLVSKGEDQMSIEVKADYMMGQTGNICIETIGNIAANKLGWIYYTQASHICFVDMASQTIHIVRTSELKDLIKQGNHKVLTREQLEEGRYYKQAQLVLIHLERLRQLEHYNQFNWQGDL